MSTTGDTIRVFADPRVSQEEVYKVISNPEYQKKATIVLKAMGPGATYVDPQYPFISVQLNPTD